MWSRSSVVFCLGFLIGGIIASGERRAQGAATVNLEQIGSPPGSAVVVRGLPQVLVQRAANWNAEQWQEVLAVFTVQGERVASIPLVGDYELQSDRLVFMPRYPLRTGLRYRALLRVPGEAEVTREFLLPEPNKGEPTRLTAIYPTTDVVPENLLKFYLHFSAPMSRGEIYRRVKLVDSQGNRVEYPFLELAEELWSPDGMRVTLYFDPGRIKRGLKPRELFGPALVAGHAYTLQIDPRWPDATGQPLAAQRPLVKSLRVVEPDDRQPETKRWKVIAPVAGTRDPLTLVFDEPLDSAMLLRVLAVLDDRGAEIAGDRELGKLESSFSFRPAVDWERGNYTIEIDTTLEDLAGNSLGRPFEVDVFRPAPDGVAEERVAVPFSVAD